MGFHNPFNHLRMARGIRLNGKAETMNFKIYNWQTKIDDVPLGDVAGHAVGVELRSAFYVLENGEVAITKIVSSYDLIMGQVRIRIT